MKFARGVCGRGRRTEGWWSVGWRAAACVAAAWSLAGTAGRAEEQPAAEVKPFAVVSVSSVNELRKDVEHVVRLATPEHQRQAVLAALDQVDAYLEGVDRARAAGGVAWFTPENEFYSLAFVPVTDAEKFYETLASHGLTLEKIEGGLRKGDGAFYKESKGYVFVSPQESALASLPDPLKVLGTLPETYDVGVSVRVDRIPGMFRQMVVGFMQPLLQAAMEAEQDERLKELQKATNEEQVRVIDQVLKELERIDFGFGVDRSGGKLYAEYVAVPKAGTKLAEAMLLTRDAKATLPLPDFERAPLALVERSQLTDLQKKSGLKLIGPSAELLKAAVDKLGIPEPKDLEVAKAVVDAVYGSIRRMTEDGAKEQVMFVERAGAGDKLYRGFLATRIPKADLLAATFEQVMGHLADRSGEEVDWKKLPKPLCGGPAYRVAVDDQLLHAIASIFQKQDDEVDKIQEAVEQVLYGVGETLGEDPELLFVFGKDVLWIGLGEKLAERVEALTAAAAAKGPATTTAPSQGVVSIVDVLRFSLPFISTKEGELAGRVEKLIPVLEKAGDRIRIVVQIDEKGRSTGRMELAEELLKVFQTIYADIDDL